MNTYNINDKEFQKTETYKKYIEENPTFGNLRIRSYAAGGAIPISNLKIIVRKIIDNNNIIFFEGITDNSGLIERIKLPTPKQNPNNLDVPNETTYDIIATYEKENLNLNYQVKMYEGVCVIQNINIVPSLMVSLEVGDIEWQ